MSYWDNFYRESKFKLKKHSNFAEYVQDSIPKNSRIIDIACGNGRDSSYFERKGHDVIGVDKSKEIDFLGSKFEVMDVTKEIPFGKVYYARFFLHTLTEKEMDNFLLLLSKKIDEESVVFFETRSAKNILNKEKGETFLKLSEGKKHFRMLYSKEYLEIKIKKYFKIDYIEESDLFAIHKTERPYIIRIKGLKK